MPKTMTDDEARRLDRWIEEVAQTTKIAADVPISELLDLTADVAHQVLRPASPITGFLLGRAMATHPEVTATELISRIRGQLATAPDGP